MAAGKQTNNYIHNPIRGGFSVHFYFRSSSQPTFIAPLETVRVVSKTDRLIGFLTRTLTVFSGSELIICNNTFNATNNNTTTATKPTAVIGSLFTQLLVSSASFATTQTTALRFQLTFTSGATLMIGQR